jgi:hypothetical protein
MRKLTTAQRVHRLLVKTPAQKLRALVKLMRSNLRAEQAKTAEQHRTIATLRTQLDEARRRTVPLKGGGGEVNFLPAAITGVRWNRDVREAVSWSGREVMVSGPATVTIECEGEVVVHPEAAANGKK